MVSRIAGNHPNALISLAGTAGHPGDWLAAVVVGVDEPLTCLLNWRMPIAERALREDGIPLSALALSLGYAFTRVLSAMPSSDRSGLRRRAGWGCYSNT